MSLSAEREALTRIHGRYQRAGRPPKSHILDEFCLNCGYHRKAALRLLKAARPAWLDHHQRRSAPLPEAMPKKVLKINPAQIDRLLRLRACNIPGKGPQPRGPARSYATRSCGNSNGSFPKRCRTSIRTTGASSSTGHRTGI